MLNTWTIPVEASLRGQIRYFCFSRLDYVRLRCTVDDEVGSRTIKVGSSVGRESVTHGRTLDQPSVTYSERNNPLHDPLASPHHLLR